MSLPKTARLSLVLLSFAVVGWSGVSAAETGDARQSVAQDAKLAAPVAESVEVDFMPLVKALNPPTVAASCYDQDCGNTGTLYGWGANCTTAKADLDSAISAAANSTCPGPVTGIDRHYGSCVEVGGQCRYDGDADIECKICPGQYCIPEA